MPSALGVSERETAELLVEWIELSARACSDEDFLAPALQSLRTLTHADSVLWVTNVEGKWRVDVHVGAARPEPPGELLAQAADEERTVRQGSWLATPVSDSAATNLLVIAHPKLDAVEATIPLLATAISSLRRTMTRLRGNGIRSSAVHATKESAEARHRTTSAMLLGESTAIQELRKRIARIADSDLTVLVHGENGTGKDIVSRMIHQLSPRASGPWLAINCAALTESLLESELFGHERGAFTDANESRAGKFELASGGTLFLDEVAELTPRAQAQLLRVLEEKTLVRVGGYEPIPVDTRLIAATNRDLGEMVASDTFRRDLFFRLNVVSLALPPLRERGDDIRILAEHFLEQAAEQRGRPCPRLTSTATEAMKAHPWPGNVRELRNVMERAVFLHDTDSLDAAQLGLAEDSTATAYSVEGGKSLADATRQFQIAYIEQHLRAGLGSMTVTAQKLGMHRTNLYRKMKQLGMTPPG